MAPGGGNLGADTVVVAGSRFSVPTKAAYNPYGFGQTVQPQPIQNVNFPPMVSGGGGSGANFGEDVGGYGTAGQNVAATQIANRQPFDIRNSPLWWAVIAAVIGLTGLILVHWRKTTLEGAESVKVGEAHEGAEAGA